MVLTSQRPVEIPPVPQLLFIDKFVDIPVVVVQRQAPMVPTLQKPVEIPQVLFLDKVVDMHVRCATRGAHGLYCAENRLGSAVAVHRQIRRHPCRVEEADPNCASVHQEAPAETVEVFEIGELLPGHPCSSRHPSWRLFQLSWNTGNPFSVVESVEPASHAAPVVTASVTTMTGASSFPNFGSADRYRHEIPDDVRGASHHVRSGPFVVNSRVEQV